MLNGSRHTGCASAFRTKVVIWGYLKKVFNYDLLYTQIMSNARFSRINYTVVDIFVV
jgi:hypothetical protein